MAIQTSDILAKLATTSGAAGNSTAQAAPNASLGKYMSSTQIVDATTNNLFDDISGDENAASTVDYRCFFFHNNHAGITLKSAKVWIFSEVSGGASVAIGLDASGVKAANSATAQATTIANETTAPLNVTFSTPTTKASGLSVGDIPASSCIGIWVRRTAANSSAKNNDGATIRIEGDTTE